FTGPSPVHRRGVVELTADDDTTWTSLLGHRHHVPATPITPPRRLSVLEVLLLKTVRKRM
ncbi:MAG: hypothetical protein ACRDOO_23560, partial [Actinomadura sp.]